MFRFLLLAILVGSGYSARNSNNGPHEEPCDQQESPQVCLFLDHFMEIPLWQFQRDRKVTTLKLVNLQSENLPVNPGDSFPNLVTYSATDTSFRILKRENLRHLRQLEELSMTNGQLIRIRRDAFDDLANLQRLELTQNLIKVLIPDSFRELQKLEFLSLKSNEIEELSPRMFRNMLNLKELTIDDNQISSISGETFGSNRRLKMISIRNNNLKFVDEMTFGGLKELSVLSLNGNDCIDKEYAVTKGRGGFLAAIRMDMSEFCQIGVKE